MEKHKVYSYGWLDKIVNVQENGTMLASFDYHINGQIAAATRSGKTENFFWDGLALIHRDGTNYVNEPYVTGGNPILADNKVLFNDILGTTLGSKDGEKFSSIQRDAFGMLSSGQTTKSESSDNFFTGKPYVGELGYAFLFRNYRAEQGKWQTADPLGYPDGWNNLAYCNNGVTDSVDFLGAWSEGGHESFFENLNITINVSGSNYVLKPEMIERIRFFDVMTDADASLTYFLTYNTQHIDFAKDPHYHAMRSPNENVDAAANAINALITSNFAKAMSLSNMDEALYYFGLASHTFQDRMAPQHYDANGPLIWYPGDFTSIRNIWNHSGELFASPSQENKSAYASQLKARLQELINQNPSWLTQMFVKE